MENAARHVRNKFQTFRDIAVYYLSFRPWEIEDMTKSWILFPARMKWAAGGKGGNDTVPMPLVHHSDSLCTYMKTCIIVSTSLSVKFDKI